MTIQNIVQVVGVVLISAILTSKLVGGRNYEHGNYIQYGENFQQTGKLRNFYEFRHSLSTKFPLQI